MFRISTMGYLMTPGQRWRQTQPTYGSQSKSFNLPLEIRKLCFLESEPLFKAEEVQSVPGAWRGTHRLLNKKCGSSTQWPLNKVHAKKSQPSFRLFRKWLAHCINFILNINPQSFLSLFLVKRYVFTQREAWKWELSAWSNMSLMKTLKD